VSAVAELDAILTRHGAALEGEMRAAVPPLERSGLYAMLQYHLGWVDAQGSPVSVYAGKHLRPTLLLLAAEAAGGEPAVAMPAAAAVELLHNFSLIHDDVQDRSPERRYRPVVWSIWGESQAINAGDAMHAVAARTLLRCAERGAAPGDVLEVAALLHECCMRLVEGQYLDLEFESREDVTVDDYLTMISGKTGALIAAAVEIGAVLGGGRAARERWREFGQQIGRAFQIVDDVLGVWGDPAVTGKPAADDVVRGKRALPFLLALARLGEPERRRLAELYRRPERDAAAVAEAIGLIDRAGARAESERAAGRHLELGLAALRETGAGGRGAEELAALGRFVLSRTR
jgi:geranylgeranyl diphosphate synthase, type I